MIEKIDAMQRIAGSLQHLENQVCISEYSSDFLSERRHLLLITHQEQQSADNSSLVQYNTDQDSSGWMCYSNTITPDSRQTMGICQTATIKPSEWSPSGSLVDHCRSEIVLPKCQLQMSLTVGYIVVICNLVKFLCMVLVACKVSPATLCTLGYLAIS